MTDNREFKHGDVEYLVLRPTTEQVVAADEYRQKIFNKSLQSGDLLRTQLEVELEKRDLWNNSLEAEYQKLKTEIINGEYALKAGGIKLEEARQIAVKMASNRIAIQGMLSNRQDLDSNTCEGKADSARFNYLLSVCLVYKESREPYFGNGIDDLLKNADELLVVKAAQEFYHLMSGLEASGVSDTPEGVFLKSYNFVDDKGRFLDKEGLLVDEEGRHIDEEGNFIKYLEDGSTIKVDSDGREVDESGEWVVEFSPFLDGDGKPLD